MWKNNKKKQRIEKRLTKNWKRRILSLAKQYETENERKKDDEKRASNISNRNHDCNAGGSSTNRMREQYGG